MHNNMSSQVDRAARVLILEDDPSLREVLEEVLMARGLNVSAAANGEEALKLARTSPFDLIVADIRMKGISGLDAIEQARLLQPDLASIVVSGYASEQETLRAVQLNVAGYLKKPFKIPQLLELVNTQLKQRRMKKQTEDEVRALRKSLLWSINRQLMWAEKVNPGEVEGPARVAKGMAQAKGLSAGLCGQVFTGTGLRASLKKSKEQLPQSLDEALKPFSSLLSSLEGDELTEFAIALAPIVDGAPQADGVEAPPEVTELYQKYLKNGDHKQIQTGGQVNEEVVETETLFTVAANMERLGDLAGASKVISPILQSKEISARAVRAHLFHGRLAARGGKTQVLEQHIKEGLQIAGKLGPSMLARGQWKGAELLREVGHPAAAKLYQRAAASLDELSLTLPWTCCTLALLGLGQELEDGKVERALGLLQDPENSSEVSELVGKFLPDLLLVTSRGNDSALELCRRFVKGFYFDLSSVLLDESHPSEIRHLVLELIRDSGLGLSQDWIEILKQADDSELSSKAAALQQQDHAATAGLRATSFGGFSVTVDGRQLTEKDWKTQKTKYLFARLLRSIPKSVNVGQIVEEFWPNKPDTSRSSLNTSVSSLRKIFRDATPAGEDAIERVGETININRNLRIWSDEQLFNEAVKQAESFWEKGDVERAIAAYSRVIRLHEGPYLDGCYLDWALVRRSQYERNVELALTRLMEHRFDQHRYRESHEYANELLALQPDETRAHEVAMLSLMGLERHQSAVTHYERYSRELQTQYGSEPALELMKVYQMAKYGFRQEGGLTDI